MKKPIKDNNLSDQFSKGLNIRQTQWPPHPDREEEVQEPPAPWSPNGQQNGDIFDDTDVTDYVPHEEHDSKVVLALGGVFIDNNFRITWRVSFTVAVHRVQATTTSHMEVAIVSHEQLLNWF